MVCETVMMAMLKALPATIPSTIARVLRITTVNANETVRAARTVEHTLGRC
jgi:hypothetical protein